VHAPGNVTTGEAVSRLAAAFSALGAAVGNASAPCNWPALQRLVDVDLLSIFVILTELSNDPDSYAKSVDVRLRDDGRLTFGPLWDKGQAYGMSGESKITGWRAEAPCAASCDVLDNAGTLFGSLFKHCRPFLSKAGGAAWKTARASGGALEDATLARLLRGWASQLQASGAVERDRSVWGIGASGSSYNGQVEALISWCRARGAWMDSHW